MKAIRAALRRVLGGERTLLRWSAEVAGVGALAIAAWMWAPPLGVAVAGAYLIVVANGGGEDAGT